MRLALSLDSPPVRSAAAAAGPPDAANLQFLAVPTGPFWQDSGRTTPAAVADPVGAWDDVSGLAQHATGSGTTRPIRRAGGVSFAEDSVSDWLVSAASALSAGWSLYLRCDVTSIVDGILAASSPTTVTEPLLNSYPTQLYRSVNAGFQTVAADAGANAVRGFTYGTFTLTTFVGGVESTAGAVSAFPIAALSIGSTLASPYRGAMQAVALYRGAHDLSTRDAVRAYLLTL